MKPSLFVVGHHFLPILIYCMLLTSCNKVKTIQHFSIDESASAMEWNRNQKDGSGDSGTIKVTGKLIAAERGEITGGEKKQPFSSLINMKLPTDELKNQLIHYLQSKDFFNEAVYRVIVFKIASLPPYKYITYTYHASGGPKMLGTTGC